MKKSKLKIFTSFIMITIFCCDIIFCNNITNNYYYGYNNPYYNPYPNFQLYPNFFNSPNYQYYPYSYNSGVNNVPYDSYYFFAGYDRSATKFSAGEVMNTRVPIISGNYQECVNIANNLIISSYKSISKWCNENVFANDVENFYLNNAVIESQNYKQIVMIVNCALEKKGLIRGNIEFRLTLNIDTNRFTWYEINDNNKNNFN